MSRVYLVTGLPMLRRGEPAPLSLAEFVSRCRQHLSGADLQEVERLLLLEEVHEGVRIQAAAKLQNQDVSGDELTTRMVGRPSATVGGPVVKELPAWMHRPQPLRMQLRHFWHLTFETAQTEFLREWADFVVNLQEVVTGLLAKRHALSRDAFLDQMRGSFDTTSRYMIEHYDATDAGIGQRFMWVGDVIAALDMADALAGERALNDVRWQGIERLTDPDPLSLDRVLAWYLKLQIVQQEASWDREAGDVRLDNVLNDCASLLEQAIQEQRALRQQEAA